MDLVQRDGSCVSYLTGLGRSHSFSDSFSNLVYTALLPQKEIVIRGLGRMVVVFWVYPS
jgi:hypothetical protein